MTRMSAAMLPRLRLSEGESGELRRCSAALEEEGCRAYESYLLDHQRHVDPTYWQLLRRDTDLRVYNERREMQRAKPEPSSVHTCFIGDRPMPREVQCPYVMQSQSSSPMASPVSSVSPSTASTASSPRSKMPLASTFFPKPSSTDNGYQLRIAGTVPGKLDDVLLGVSFRDTPTLRERNAYEKNCMDDCAVLTTVEGPSVEDPFRFLGVVWKYRHVPSAGLIRSRDMMLLAHVHQSSLPATGERIGVLIYHSLEHNALQPFSSPEHVVRLRTSMVMVFRQLDDHRVDVYGHYWNNPDGHTPSRIILMESARAALTFGCTEGTALARKLVRAMLTPSFSPRESSALPRRGSSANANAMPPRATISSGPSVSEKSVCGVCSTRLVSGIFSTRGCLCRLCNQHVCSKCEIVKQLVLTDPDGTVEIKPFHFCIACTMAVNTLPAAEVVTRGLMPQVKPKTEPFAGRRPPPPPLPSVTARNTRLVQTDLTPTTTPLDSCTGVDRKLSSSSLN